MIRIPPYDQLFNPTIQALQALGGSGTIEEIAIKVAEIMNLSDEQVELIHNPEKGNQTQLEYRLAWSRTYLKKCGILENSSRGVWALTPLGRQKGKVDPVIVKRTVQGQLKSSQPPSIPTGEQPDTEIFWRDKALETLLQMDPFAFERLAQRLLRESGFIQVEVTGRSGDGGIDGKGIMRLGGLLSFHVIFQCKRYRGTVTASQVRDFRGAMVGRADKGLLITTGNFTKDAVREATRDGAPAIDLIDGDLLVDKLKELEMGIHTRQVVVEQVDIDTEWFLTL